MMGTRGVPARYGGFETAVEEVGTRLAARGHDVVVYCRGGDPSQTSYRGMRLVHLGAVRHRALETLTHTMASTRHIRHEGGYDAVLLFNCANAFVLPWLRRVAPGVAVHVDGLEWRRAKWGRFGRTWYLLMERVAARRATALIADARAIQDYYADRYGVPSVNLAYGAPLRAKTEPKHLHAHGLVSGGYDLVVARLEPENHTDIAVAGHLASNRRTPLVVVGSVPYPSPYSQALAEQASRSSSVMMLGGVWDAEELDELYAHCRLYVHGHSVGGTNPALLRAMGAGAPVVALDVVFNREVLGETGEFFSDAEHLAALLDAADGQRAELAARGCAGQQRVRERYDWDEVAEGYERLCAHLAQGRAV